MTPYFQNFGVTTELNQMGASNNEDKLNLTLQLTSHFFKKQKIQKGVDKKATTKP